MIKGFAKQGIDKSNCPEYKRAKKHAAIAILILAPLFSALVYYIIVRLACRKCQLKNKKG